MRLPSVVDEALLLVFNATQSLGWRWLLFLVVRVVIISISVIAELVYLSLFKFVLHLIIKVLINDALWLILLLGRHDESRDLNIQEAWLLPETITSAVLVAVFE